MIQPWYHNLENFGATNSAIEDGLNQEIAKS